MSELHSEEATNREKTNESKHSDLTQGWILVNPRILIGLVGTIACFGWFCLLLGTWFFIPVLEEQREVSFLYNIAMLLGCILALFLTWLLSDVISRHRKIFFLATVVLTIIGFLWFVLYEASFEWHLLFSLCTGLGFGFLYVQYGEYICLFFYAHIKSYIVGIILVAVLLVGGILVVHPSLRIVFYVVFPLVALVAYAIQMIMFRLDKPVLISAQVSDIRSQVKWRSYLATTTADLPLGFGLGCLLSSQQGSSWTMYLLVFMLVAVCIVLFIDSLKKNYLGESISMRWFLPISAVIVFPMLFVPNELRSVFEIALIAGAMLPVIFSLDAMCRHIIYCDLSKLRAFAFGRVVAVAGLLVGVCLGYFGFSSLSIGFFGESVSIIAIVIFLFLVILSASFVMIENNYPEKSRFKEATRIGPDGEEESILVYSGKSIYPLDEEPAKPDDSNEWLEKGGRFIRKCIQAAEVYGLSERQKEVLIMLAKGRNSEYITKKLVISSHTAKAHIYNIYQKTGVHSRQELMDLVEETKLDDE